MLRRPSTRLEAAGASRHMPNDDMGILKLDTEAPSAIHGRIEQQQLVATAAATTTKVIVVRNRHRRCLPRCHRQDRTAYELGLTSSCKHSTPQAFEPRIAICHFGLRRRA